MKTNLFTVACTCAIICTLFCLAVDGVPETAAERSRNLRQRRLRNRGDQPVPDHKDREQVYNLRQILILMYVDFSFIRHSWKFAELTNSFPHKTVDRFAPANFAWQVSGY